MWKILFFSIEVREYDIPQHCAEFLMFAINHPIWWAHEQAECANDLLMLPLFYDPISLVSVIGMVATCTDALQIFDAAIHKITGLPCKGPEVPLAARHDRQVIAKEFCVHLSDANTSVIQVDGLKDPELWWIMQFIVVRLLGRQKYTHSHTTAYSYRTGQGRTVWFCLVSHACIA
eukprot:Gb_18077 [translate_table: standard]